MTLGNFTFGGSNPLNLGTGAVTNGGSYTVTLNGNNPLTFGGVMTNTLAGVNTLTVNNGSRHRRRHRAEPGRLQPQQRRHRLHRRDQRHGQRHHHRPRRQRRHRAASGLTYAGPGTLTLTGTAASTYTGATTVNAGTMLLDFSTMTTPTNLINSASALTLGGGTLSIKGNSSGSTSQTFASTTLKAGGSAIVVNGNGGAAPR